MTESSSAYLCSKEDHLLLVSNLSSVCIPQILTLEKTEQLSSVHTFQIIYDFHNLSPFAFSSMILSPASFILSFFQNLGICFSSSIPGPLAQPCLKHVAAYPKEDAVITRHLEALDTLSEILKESSTVSRSRGSSTPH